MTQTSSNPDGKVNGSTQIKPWQQMLSSGTGAMLTSLFVTPLDVVKIRLQAQQKDFGNNQKCFIYCNGLWDHLCYCVHNSKGSQLNKTSNLSMSCQLHRLAGAGGAGATILQQHCQHSQSKYHSISVFADELDGQKGGKVGGGGGGRQVWFRKPDVHLTGTLDAFAKISRTEGVASLWSGLPPTLVMAIPATVLYFSTYDYLCTVFRRRYEPNPQDPSVAWIPPLAGAISRTFAVTIISPLEMIRTKMQSKRLSYSQVGTAIKQTIQQGGILSMWKGLAPTVARDVPFSSLYWYNYEMLKHKFHQTNEPSFGFCFVAGAVSGTIAGVVTLPFDVVKTHRQIELGEMELAGSGRARSTLQVMKGIYTDHGVRGLFAGIVPRISKVAPACAIMISTYEVSKSFFKRYNESHPN